MSPKNWPILLKSLALPLALGLLALFAGLFASASMKSIDDNYAAIIAGPEKAAMANIRANRFISAFARDGYRLATSLDADGIQAGNDAIADDKTKMDAQFAVAIAADPEHANDYKSFQTTAHTAIEDACAETIQIGQSTDPDSVAKATLAMNKTCAPALGAVIDAMTTYNDQLIAGLDKKSAALSVQTERTRLLTVAIIIGGLIAVALAGVWMTLRFLVAPIKALNATMENLAKGQLSLNVPGQERKDEIGQMARTTEVFRKSLEETEQLRKDGEALKLKAEQDKRQAMLDLAGDFETSVGGIVALVSSAATEMQAAAAQLTATAQETSAQSIAVSAAAEEAGANVVSVASSTEELGASVSEIGRQVETSSDIAKSALTEAHQAGAIVAELNETAASIGSVVDLIAGLASQTNLLALNATIESARAGEAGKGFAVVASEVKALAAQTAKATTDISDKIGKIQDATGRAAEAMQTITGTIANISHTSIAIASAVDQQMAATQEIVQAVNQASVGTQEVTSNISGVAQAAEQTGDAAAQVLSSSRELSTQAERLNLEMDKFLATVRAA